MMVILHSLSILHTYLGLGPANTYIGEGYSSIPEDYFVCVCRTVAVIQCTHLTPEMMQN